MVPPNGEGKSLPELIQRQQEIIETLSNMNEYYEKALLEAKDEITRLRRLLKSHGIDHTPLG